jgi:hypothetical protein
MIDRVIRPFRWRTIEDMSIRKLPAKTQHDYLKDFAAFLSRSPDTAKSEEGINFKVHRPCPI